MGKWTPQKSGEMLTEEKMWRWMKWKKQTNGSQELRKINTHQKWENGWNQINVQSCIIIHCRRCCQICPHDEAPACLVHHTICVNSKIVQTTRTKGKNSLQTHLLGWVQELLRLQFSVQLVCSICCLRDEWLYSHTPADIFQAQKLQRKEKDTSLCRIRCLWNERSSTRTTVQSFTFEKFAGGQMPPCLSAAAVACKTNDSTKNHWQCKFKDATKSYEHHGENNRDRVRSRVCCLRNPCFNPQTLEKISLKGWKCTTQS